jgi:4-hydroxybenzoyl-CoA thioesterase
LATGFETAVEVRFGDCDPAGIVYYPRLYHYCHVAFEDAWRRALGTPYAELVARHRIGFPTVHVETDFVEPLRYGDTALIRVTVPRVGRTSVVFAFDAGVGDRQAFRSTHTTVCLDLDTFEKRPISEPLLAAFARLGA